MCLRHTLHLSPWTKRRNCHLSSAKLVLKHLPAYCILRGLRPALTAMPLGNAVPHMLPGSEALMTSQRAALHRA